MINTTVGNVDKKYLKKHFDKMIGKTFKIIHLKEEGCITVDKYVGSLCRKFLGASSLYFSEDIIMIIHILKGLDLDDHDSLRSDIFEIIKILEFLKKRCD